MANEGTAWVETTKQHWIDTNGDENSLEGTLVAAGSNPEGTWWVETTYYHYIDEEGDERREEGTLVGAGSNPAGTRWFEGTDLHYIDEEGDERSLPVAIIGVVINSSGFFIRIRRASDGRLWVAYQDGTSLCARYSDDDGATWSAAETVVTEAYSGTIYGVYPDIVIDSNDVPHIVYSVRTGTTTQNKLYYTNRIGGTWSAKEDITSTTAYYRCPKIAIDSGDNIHIIYHVGTTATAKATYIKGSAGSWGSPFSVDTNSYHDLGSQDIAIDSNDYVHVAYTSRRSRSVYYRLYNGSWQAEETLYTQDDYNVTQCAPHIAIDSNDDVHYVWTGKGHGTNTGYHNIQYMKRTSGSWGSQVGLSDLAVHQAATSRTNPYGYGLDISITTGDVLHVVWQWQIKHISYDGSWGAIDEPTDESGTEVYQLLCHRHPSNQGILASGYYLVFGITALRFYEGA